MTRIRVTLDDRAVQAALSQHRIPYVLMVVADEQI